MNEKKFDPYQSLIFLTNRVGRLLSNLVKEKTRKAEMADIFPHMGVMVDLWLQDGVRQRELTVSVIKDKGTIARSLDVLEKHGMIFRKKDEKDKRQKRIYLTQKGRDMHRHLIPGATQAVFRATEGISTEDIETCKWVLIRMYRNLNPADGHAPAKSVRGR